MDDCLHAVAIMCRSIASSKQAKYVVMLTLAKRTALLIVGVRSSRVRYSHQLGPHDSVDIPVNKLKLHNPQI